MSIGDGQGAAIYSKQVFTRDLFAGRTAFISGGTSGINLGIAKGLAACGAKVAVLGRNSEKAELAAVEISKYGAEALALTGDVRDFAATEAAVAKTVEKFGDLDFVIAGAAGNFVAAAEKLSPNGFATVVNIDLNGSFHVFKAAHPHLKTPGASLIAISAGQATRASWGQVHVASAKAGVEALVRGLALEWGPAGIRVNSICPGPIAGTEGVDRLMPAALIEKAHAQLPLRRFGRTDEIADAAIFLLSPAAAYITGASIACDGGLALVHEM